VACLALQQVITFLLLDTGWMGMISQLQLPGTFLEEVVCF
jgi:hypothetical protein